ncbi:MAG: hypothetical protein BWK79_03860 [Beggiatoa sp. IS2]|nr:MAG: hypothetical protein BWK79_03860 [Beggiatoa sp. IS2]
MSPIISDQELRRFYLFAGLDEPQLARIKRQMRVIELSEGTQLFDQGESASSFFVVLSGHIKLIRLSAEGSEKVIEVINAGESFAEAVMFMPQQIYPVTAKAIDHSQILSFSNKVFLDILQDSFETCLRVLGAMSQRIHWWLKEVDHLTLQNATYRLVSYLLCQLPKNSSDKNCQINFDIPKHTVASRLSMQPETLSRILHYLSQQGLITVEKQTIYIHNVEKLRWYSQSSPEQNDFQPCQ